ncbi:hypothetical protein QVD99_008100 [Batrachochytrium dendrobatidis]|uniref:Protein YOP1 n=1 Tax=Batrachochytrium dendrobatidis (strain JEL423) TaxID=403673 RepID=A0A177WCL0_BATDL|nr:hypothetical protein O5D80_004749 [Batrachochytrium dendrobatidis]KAK5665256.1 hypothetical protein QVD99_008100 [Batrachochytrium dendrobatidis]OAJ37465.1 hypothetical protein BDEG_21481 [Batrachochytrium dendrobatidis JEL423]
MPDIPLPAIAITLTNTTMLFSNWKAMTETVEKLLGNVPPLVALEKAYKITKRHCLLLITLSILWTILVIKNVQGGPLTDLVGFSFPAYASIKAVDSGDKVKYTHWLSYWVIFALLKLIENFHITILQVLPFYFIFKMVFLLWAMSKYSMGAYVFYHGIVKHWIPFLDRTFGSMLGGVMSDALKASVDAEAKLPAPPKQTIILNPRIGHAILATPGPGFKAASAKWGHASMGLRGR